MIEKNSVIHGDCLEVMKQIPDKSIDLILTSPPYNMRTRVRNGRYTTREKSEHFSKKYKYFDDALPIDEYYHFHKNCLNEMIRISKLIFWNVGIVTGSKEAIFKIIGDFNKYIKDIIIWDKGYAQPSMHSGIINRVSELILIFQSDGVAGREIANAYFKRGELDDIWRIKRGRSHPEHSAAFPIEMAEKVIYNFSKEKQIILDPFAGTGTTAIACTNLNRNYILIEKEEKYIDIINKRIQKRKDELKYQELDMFAEVN